MGIARTGTAGRDTLFGTTTNDTLKGLAGDDWLDGGAGDDSLDGGSGNDTLYGGAGNDTLRGDLGTLSFYGGTGNDTLITGGTASMTAYFGRGDGQDTIASHPDWATGVNTLQFTGTITKADITVAVSGTSLVLGLRGTTDAVTIGGFYNPTPFSGPNIGGRMAGVQQVKFANGTSWTMDELKAIVFAGTTGNDSIRGTYLADTISGGAGNDTVYGYEGNDVITTGTGNDWVDGGSGNDTITGSYTGADVLYGGEGDDSINGLSGSDTLYGGTGNDTLRGDEGTLAFYGGAGNDTLMTGGMASMTAYFGRGDGQDVIAAHPDWATSVNTLQFTGAITKADITVAVSGAALVLGIRGTTDTVTLGGFYNYSVATPEGSNIGGAMTGVQTVRFADGTSWTLEDLKAIVFAGTDGNDAIRGSFRNDTISGGAGNDTVYGYGGNDVIVTGTGNDWADGGSGNDTITGSYTGSDVLYGGDGDDSINGLLGSDTLYGGTGNDTLRGDEGTLSFYGGAGNDTLMTGGMASMTAYFGRGDGQDTIVGHADWAHSINTLQFTGAITKADITFTVSGTSLVLGLRGTTDSVTIDRFYNYGPPAPEGYNIGGGMSGVQLVQFADGSAWTLDDLKAIVFAGTAGNDSINGTWQADTMFGGAGNDTLMGMGGDDRLEGGAGNDTLSGGSGRDTLIGGAGDDRYLLDTPIGNPTDGVLDVIIEDANGGTDTVIAPDSYTLGANLENLVVNGYATTPADIANKVFSGTGNTLANTLEGNGLRNALYGLAGDDRLFGYGGNDWLDGGTGNDTMTGGTGDDTYVVDAAGDVVTELAGEGTDLVQASVHHILAANIENLTMISAAALNGTGNLLNNVLTGNAAANVLTGAGGNDTLYGLGGNDILYGSYSGNDLLFGGEGNDAVNGLYGNDTLSGGLGNDTLDGSYGNDTYQFGRGEGIDRIIESDNTTTGVDTLQLFTGVSREQVWWRKSGSDLEMSIIGTTDKVTVQNWYAGKANHVEQFRTADGKVLLDTQVDALVNAMAAFAPPAVGQTTLSAAYQTALNPVIAANWK